MTGMEVPVTTASTREGTSSNLKERMEDIRRALSTRELTSRQQRLLAALLTYMPFDGGGWPLSTGLLAENLYGKDSRTSRTNTTKVLRELRELGFITTEKRSSVYDKQGSNRIFVELPRLYMHAVTVTSPEVMVTSPEVTMTSTDVTLNATEVTVKGAISSTQGHIAPLSQPHEHLAHEVSCAHDQSTEDRREEHLPPPSSLRSSVGEAPGGEGPGAFAGSGWVRR